MNSAADSRLSADVLQAIRIYLANGSKIRAVSTFETIQEMRRLFPSLRATDVELTDSIAGAAIILNMAIAFDATTNGALFKPVSEGWPH